MENVGQGSHPRPSTQRSSHERAGERRVITILFCDVAGSTALAESFDPEEWAEIMNEVFGYLNEPVHRYGGTVARLMGDGILAFFGAPSAHEDDPQRAVLAGLGILDGIKEFQQEFQRDYGQDFNVRVGINTGPVVVGEVGSDQAHEYTAMGDAVNLAARMEQTAAPGTIQISGDTFRLVAPLFDMEALGGVEVKGKSEPVTAYRVVSHKAVPGRTRGIEGLNAPMVGRDDEMARLRQVLADLRQGHGAIVTIIGEAGLGKSRLIDELRSEWEKTATSDASWVVSHGVSYDTTRPYGLFMQRVLQIYGIEENDSLELVREKVAITPEGFPPQLQTVVVSTLEALLAAGRDSEAPQMEGDVVQRELYEACHSMWRAAASLAPTVIVVDDLHWADPASVELMIDMFPMVDELPLLFLCSFRPDRQSPAWRVKQAAETDFPHRYTEISLSALSDEDSDVLFGNLFNISDSPPQLHQIILAKAQGNPLFVEEFTRTLIDAGAVTFHEGAGHWDPDAKVDQIAIPENLQALLTSRIDRLEEGARSTLQLCSVIGRSFYHRVLGQVSDSKGGLDQQLDTLQTAELIREAASDPEVEYVFRHDLTRDAAYNSILFRRRRQFHRRVGEAIEELFGGRLEEQAHRLAYHFYEAKDNDRALKYSTMAGDVAAGLYANDEAVTHYTRAIELAREAGPPEDGKGELARLLEILGGLKRRLGDASGSSLLYEEASQLLSSADYDS